MYNVARASRFFCQEKRDARAKLPYAPTGAIRHDDNDDDVQSCCFIYLHFVLLVRAMYIFTSISPHSPNSDHRSFSSLVRLANPPTYSVLHSLSNVPTPPISSL